MQDQKQVYQQKQSIRQLMEEHRNSPDANQMEIIVQNQWSLQTKPQYKGSDIHVVRFFVPHGIWKATKWDKAVAYGLEVTTPFDSGIKDKDGFFTSIKGYSLMGLYPHNPIFYKADIKAWKLIDKFPVDDDCPLGLKFGIDYGLEGSPTPCFGSSCIQWVECSMLHDEYVAEFPPKNITRPLMPSKDRMIHHKNQQNGVNQSKQKDIPV